MNRRLVFLIGLTLISSCAAIRLAQRWQEESTSRQVAIISDWNEVRTLSSRSGIDDAALAVALRNHGATAVFLSASTLNDLALTHRVKSTGKGPGMDFWDTSSITLADAALARQVRRELERRGVHDLFTSGPAMTILGRSKGTFSDIRDIEIGVDPELLNRVREAGLIPALRLNRDPWMSADDAEASIGDDPALAQAGAILFNTDDVPGGQAALPAWKQWLSDAPVLLPLFEFHPSRATLDLAHQLPGQTLRAHTIPSLELKEMTPPEEASRWRRAVIERSCRLLLVHAAPADSWDDYLDRVATLKTELQKDSWTIGWPESRTGWTVPSALPLAFFSVMAFLTALVTPWAAFLIGRRPSSWLGSYALISLLTVIGACWAAALAQNSWTRLELMPFRGIKLAFVLSWLGSAFIIYGVHDLVEVLKKPLRRWDLLLGLAATAMVAYIVIRSGNASASWKSPLEQHFRDYVEWLLVARPRFKEFAFGHPLLILGLFFEQCRRQKLWSVDGRPWMLIGMMGQSSMVNTFCHLHSPLWLAFLRSLYGVLAGGILGTILVGIASKFRLRRSTETA